jgi:hypothetical protein
MSKLTFSIKSSFSQIRFPNERLKWYMSEKMLAQVAKYVW